MKIEGFDDSFLSNPSSSNSEQIAFQSNYLETVIKLSAAMIDVNIDFSDELYCNSLIMTIVHFHTKDDFKKAFNLVNKKNKYYNELKTVIENGVDIADYALDAVYLFNKYNAIDKKTANLLSAIFHSQELNYLKIFINYCFDKKINVNFASILKCLFNFQKLMIPYMIELTRPFTVEDLEKLDPDFGEYVLNYIDGLYDNEYAAIELDIVYDEIDWFLEKNKCSNNFANLFKDILYDNYVDVVYLRSLPDVVMDELEEYKYLTKQERENFIKFVNDIIKSIENKFLE